LAEVPRADKPSTYQTDADTCRATITGASAAWAQTMLKLEHIDRAIKQRATRKFLNMNVLFTSENVPLACLKTIVKWIN
jgi:hypothetical protein